MAAIRFGGRLPPNVPHVPLGLYARVGFSGEDAHSDAEDDPPEAENHSSNRSCRMLVCWYVVTGPRSP